MIIDGVQTSAFVINRVSSEVDSLDELDAVIIKTVADKVSVMQDMKQSIISSLSEPSLLSDPGVLVRVQAAMAEYNLQIAMFEKMAASGLKAIDSLVKS